MMFFCLSCCSALNCSMCITLPLSLCPSLLFSLHLLELALSLCCPTCANFILFLISNLFDLHCYSSLSELCPPFTVCGLAEFLRHVCTSLCMSHGRHCLPNSCWPICILLSHVVAPSWHALCDMYRTSSSHCHFVFSAMTCINWPPSWCPQCLQGYLRSKSTTKNCVNTFFKFVVLLWKLRALTFSLLVCCLDMVA